MNLGPTVHRTDALWGLLCLSLLLGACAQLPSLGVVKVDGRVVPDTGHIRVERDGSQLSTRAAMELRPGDSITTDASSSLVLRFGDASAVLMPSSKVSIGSIFTWFGRVFVSGWLQGKSKLVTAAVKGTQYAVEVDERSGLTTISVLEGVVEVSSVSGAFPPRVLHDAERLRIAPSLDAPLEVEVIERAEYNTLIRAANSARDLAADGPLLPDLTGETEQGAKDRLAALGVQVRRTAVPAPSPGDLGLVAGQEPRPGKAARAVELRVGRAFVPGSDKVEITPSPEGGAGSRLELRWTGPNSPDDRIVLVPAGTPDDKYWPGLSSSAAGGRARLRVPAEPGRYEVRYLAGGQATPLARVPLEVPPAVARLKVTSAIVDAGARVAVSWEGPNRDDDTVGIITVGSDDGLTDLTPGATVSAAAGHAELQVPARAGEYEIRYGLAGSWFTHAVVLARVRLTVKPSRASISAPSAAPAGSSIEFAWQGPNGERDALWLVPEEAADRISYDALRVPAKMGRGTLRLPVDPGNYELRYALAGSAAEGAVRAGSWIARQEIIARSKLVVTPAEAAITAPATGEAGSTIEVRWTGPNRPGDRVRVLPAGAGDNELYYDLDLPAEPGHALLQLPSHAGTFELRYALGGPRLKQAGIIGRSPLRVSAAEATVRAPQSVRAGSEIQASWTGPMRAGDRLELVPKGTPDGTYFQDQQYPAQPGRASILAPKEPGEYELRYHVGGATLRGGNPIAGRATLTVVR